MIRKILAGSLIGISSILLGLSIAGVILIQTYREPLTRGATARLQLINLELGQAQTALQNAELELERTLQMVETAEKSLITLKADFAQAKTFFGDLNGTLEKQLLPGLKTSREQIEQAKNSLQELRATLSKLKALPLATVNLPDDELLGELVASAGSLDAQILQVQSLVKKASSFMEEASYLMEGDLTQTKTELQNFLTVVQTYAQKFSGWRDQLTLLIGVLPAWIEAASVGLTIFLLWFGFSQCSLILNGLSLWRGNKLRT